MIDPTTDANLSHFYHITRIIDLPDFVKSASLPTPEEVSTLPNTAFADVINRLFPVHTKAACYLSYAYYRRQREGLDKQAQRRIDGQFDKMANFWELGSNLEKVAQAMEPVIEKVAAADDDYALTIDIEGENVKALPINTYDNLTKSASELISTRGKLPYSLRKSAATKMLLKLQDMHLASTEMPTELYNMAGMGVTVKEAALNQIKRRTTAQMNETEKKAAAALTKLAEVIEKSEEEILPVQVLEKVATALDVFDRFTGMDKYYGVSLPYPEDALFGFTKKAADKIKNELVSLINGKSYWLSDMVKAGQSAFDILGDLKDDMINFDGSLDMYKVAQIVPTLPRGEADLLDRALQTVGVPHATLDKVAMVRRALNIKKAEKEPEKEKKPETKEDRSNDVKLARARDTMAKLKARAADGKYMPHAPNSTSLTKVD